MKLASQNQRTQHMDITDFQGCSFCLLYRERLCSGAPDSTSAIEQPNISPAVKLSRHTIYARHMIHSPKEFSDCVICICAGQAISSIALPDGRRQILETLLPGDLLFWTNLFEPMSGRLIEATENSVYRKINRGEFFAFLAQRPKAFDVFMHMCTRKIDESDQLALTLGRRNSLQRIARLILKLVTNATERGLADDQIIRFPLRARHIADATGLTPVHTSKVLRQLRREKIIDIKARSLRVTDMMKLQQIAGP